MKPEERIGEKVNDWTIISHIKNTDPKYHRIHYNFQCKCGFIKKYEYFYMKREGKQCCIKCRQKHRTLKENFVGNKVDEWTVLEEIDDRDFFDGPRRWVVQCPCGYKRTFDYCQMTKNVKDKKNKPNVCCYKCVKKRGLEDKKFLTVMPDSFWNRFLSGRDSRNLEKTITKNYVLKLFKKQKGLCKLTKIPLFFSSSLIPKMREYTTASLDRIDSSKGYIKGNVQWVHKWINIMKWDFTMEEFVDFCKKVAENN